MKKRLVPLIWALVALSPAAAAIATPGDLDPTFSTDGLVTGRSFEYVQSVAVDGTGAVVIGGAERPTSDRVSVLRYLPDGTLDPEFGVDGVAMPDLGATASLEELATDSAGRIVGGTVIGELGSGNLSLDFGVFRLLRDGTLDPSFGDDGAVRLDFGQFDFLTGLALQDDGRLIVAGRGSDGATSGIALARLGPDGALDDSFSGDGRLVFDPGFNYIPPEHVEVAVDGEAILLGGGLGGTFGSSASEGDAFVIKLEPDGDLDPDFGDEGVSRLTFGRRGAVESLAVQPDGRIAFAGSSCGLSFDCAPIVGRLLTGGGLDPSFDGDGWRGCCFNRQPGPFALQADGSLVLGGDAEAGKRTLVDFAIQRLAPSGAPDPSFSGDGLLTTDFAFAHDGVDALALAPDGRIVAAGGEFKGRYGIARYLVSEGPADADADAILDAGDRCPLRFSERASGCPRASKGTLSLRAKANSHVLKGRLSGENRGCVAARPIHLLQAGETGRRQFADVLTGYGGHYRKHRDRQLPEGTYFAVAKRFFDPDVGLCKRVESQPDQVR